MKDKITVSLDDIRVMKHAIGYCKGNIKRNKYKYYRNYFCVEHKDEQWENLVNKNLAIKENNNKANKHIYYYVNKNGIKLLENILDIKIEEMQ